MVGRFEPTLRDDQQPLNLGEPLLGLVRTLTPSRPLTQ